MRADLRRAVALTAILAKLCLPLESDGWVERLSEDLSGGSAPALHYFGGLPASSWNGSNYTIFTPQRLPQADLVSSTRSMCFHDVGDGILLQTGPFTVCSVKDFNAAVRCTESRCLSGASIVSLDQGLSWRLLQQADSLMRSDTASLEWDAPNSSNLTQPDESVAPKRAACMVGGFVLPKFNSSTTNSTGCDADSAEPGVAPVPTSSVLCFNSTLQQWAEHAALPFAMAQTAAVFWRGAVYTFGGRISLCADDDDDNGAGCGSYLALGTTDRFAPILIGSVTGDGVGIAGWRVGKRLSPVSARYSMSAIVWSGIRPSRGPGFSPADGDEIVLPPQQESIMLMGGQTVTTVAQAPSNATLAQNMTWVVLMELYSQVPVWVVLDPLMDEVQLNFAVTIVGASGGGPGADGENGHPPDSSAPNNGTSAFPCVLAGFNGRRGRVTFRREPVASLCPRRRLEADPCSVRRALDARNGTAADWYHMVGLELPSALYQSSGTGSTGWLVKLTGNMASSTMGNLLPGSEVILVVTDRGAYVTATGGSAFDVISNYFGAPSLGSTAMPGSRPPLASLIMGLGVTHASQDGSPVIVIGASGGVFTAHVRACNSTCLPAVTYAAGCRLSPWDNTCAPCSSCVAGLEVIQRRCRTGPLLISNKDTVCRPCSACGPGMTAAAVCTFDNDTQCALAPINPILPINPALPKPIIDQAGVDAWKMTIIAAVVVTGIVATGMAVRLAAASVLSKSSAAAGQSFAAVNGGSDGASSPTPLAPQPVRIADIIDCAVDYLMSWRPELLVTGLTACTIVSQLFWCTRLMFQCSDAVGYYCSGATLAAAYSVLVIYCVSSLLFALATRNLLTDQPARLAIAAVHPRLLAQLPRLHRPPTTVAGAISTTADKSATGNYTAAITIMRALGLLVRDAPVIVAIIALHYCRGALPILDVSDAVSLTAVILGLLLAAADVIIILHELRLALRPVHSPITSVASVPELEVKVADAVAGAAARAHVEGIAAAAQSSFQRHPDTWPRSTAAASLTPLAAATPVNRVHPPVSLPPSSTSSSSSASSMAAARDRAAAAAAAATGGHAPAAVAPSSAALLELAPLSRPQLPEQSHRHRVVANQLQLQGLAARHANIAVRNPLGHLSPDQHSSGGSSSTSRSASDVPQASTGPTTAQHRRSGRVAPALQSPGMAGSTARPNAVGRAYPAGYGAGDGDAGGDGKTELRERHRRPAALNTAVNIGDVDSATSFAMHRATGSTLSSGQTGPMHTTTSTMSASSSSSADTVPSREPSFGSLASVNIADQSTPVVPLPAAGDVVLDGSLASLCLGPVNIFLTSSVMHVAGGSTTSDSESDHSPPDSFALRSFIR